jgi:protein-disulfide isomerase
MMFATSQTVIAAEQKALTKQEVEKIVREYLLNNPEILLEISQILDLRQKAARASRFDTAMAELKSELIGIKGAGFIGNADGKTVIIEFSDYNCPYCKRMSSMVSQAIKADNNIKVVLREFPILGASSEYAAKAALAAKLQGKYQQAHFALISTRGSLSKARTRKILAGVGVDVARLEKDMERPEIKAAIDRNLQMGQLLGINGTPAFIAGGTLFPGALDVPQFSRLLKLAKPNQN